MQINHEDTFSTFSCRQSHKEYFGALKPFLHYWDRVRFSDPDIDGRMEENGLPAT